jgi:proline iminopeptidase
MGVIMINTPPHFNPGYMDIIWANWEEKASDERKKIYEDNQQSLQSINRDSIPGEEWTYLSYQASVPMDWYDPEYDVSELYPQFRINYKGWNHFLSIMREYDIARSQIETPIFLSLAKYDYAMPEIIWDDYQDTLEELTIFRFEKSGHYPHVEEQELFDSQLLSWIKEK